MQHIQVHEGGGRFRKKMIYDPKSERTLSVSQTKKWVITSVQSRVQLISGTDKMNL